MKASVLLALLLPVSAATAQWVAIPTGGIDEFESVVVLDNDSYIVAGEDSAVFRTDDGGSTWSPVAGLGNETVRDFLRLDAQTILAASDGFVVRSTNNGTSWTQISVPAPDDLHALARAGSTVIGVGREGGIVRSNDLGLTWTAQASGTTERLFTAWAFSATDMLAAGRDGIAVRTTNGSTWTATSMGGNDSWEGMHFFQGAPATGLVCGEDGTLMRSTNSGTTWTPVSTGSAMGLTAIASENDGTVYVAGTTGTALRSTDMGLTWTVMTSPSIFVMNDIDAYSGVAVMCGANGSVLKLGGGGGIGINEIDAIAQVRAWPVPAQEQLFVDLSSLSGAVDLEIRSMDGRLAARQQQTSTTVATIATDALAEGHYVLFITDREGRRARSSFAVAR